MSPATDLKTRADFEQMFNRWALAAQRELELIVFVLKERGLGRFGRILSLGAVAVFLSYALIYSPAKKKVEGLDRRIAAAKSTAQYADRYKDTRQRLDRVYSELPVSGQADAWLLDKVRETLSARNLVPDSIPSPQSHPSSGVTEQIVEFTVKAKFPEIVAWLNDLEFGKGLIQVTALSISRDSGARATSEEDIGLNSVTCTVETLIPLSRSGKP